MKNTIISKLSLVLIIILMITLTSCNIFNNKKDLWSDAIYKVDTELGVGAKTVIIDVCVKEHSVRFTIHTDAKTLGEALLEHKLIEGEDSQYGMYIKKVNGIIADYDIDGSYWGFYKYDNEYMMSGVDTTEIHDGDHFQLVYEK
ncbi:MAG: DUF4430 domain-containing protein [Clostridia bacterium]|nr:DUF4430 domain-containing protein [Clostridia bacterium]